MAFVVGNKVWFKRAGSTPYVTGDAADPALAVKNQLGGRGKPNVARSQAAVSGLSDNQGVPTIKFADFPAPEASDDTAANTFPAGGEHLGVRDQVTDNNPLAPGAVATDGVFDGPTSKALFDPSKDDGDTTPASDTIKDIDPSFPSGRPHAAVSGGDTTPHANNQDFVAETVNVKGHTVGVRLPSSEEGPGTVIEVVTVKSAGISVDGTKVKAGDKQYWVDWGSSAASNPHRSKHNNRMRTTLHAEADLVAA
jgi:hypothetical protein